MHIASYGGGTNSTALIIKLIKDKRPIDYILFADTGGEKPETYEYIEIFSAWVQAQGYPGIITLHYITKDGDPLTLEQDLLNQGVLPPPCYGGKSCSEKFKIRVVDKFIRSLPKSTQIWDDGGKVVKYIGFDLGEERRKDSAILYDIVYPKFKKLYPLIDDYRMDRAACVAEIKSAGLPLPGKSSCFFCPNTKKRELQDLLKNHPELYERAVQLERRGMPYSQSANVKGLGRDYSWEEHRAYLESPLIKDQVSMFCESDDEDSTMPCGCFDG
jgi:hypothetical protein